MRKVKIEHRNFSYAFFRANSQFSQCDEQIKKMWMNRFSFRRPRKMLI